MGTKAIVLKCRPGATFHFGSYSPDNNTALNDSDCMMHSDALFSALIRTYDDLYDDTDEFVKQFELGHITISSCFYCIEKPGNDFIWFLPKPLSFDLQKTENYKEYKKIKYLSLNLWNKTNSVSDFARMFENEELTVIKGGFAVLPEEIPRALEKDFYLYREQTQPKVWVHHNGDEDSIYQLTTIEIANTDALIVGSMVHFYFLCKSNGQFKDYEKRFDCTLEVLAHNGIGAERSTIGMINEVIDTDINLPQDEGQHYVSLSLLSPDKTEINELKYYNTVFRGGRRLGGNTGTFRYLKTLRMLSEGSVLKKDIKGAVHNIAPDVHAKYLRYGKSFNIPIKDDWIL